MKPDFTDDTLTLYFYDDGLSPAERQRVQRAMSEDPALAERYRRLSAELSRMQPEASEALPADMLARFHDTIDRAAALERQADDRPAPRVHFMSFFWGAAITAALALGIGIGVLVSGDRTADLPPDVTLAGGQPRDTTAFTRGLQVHFRDSQQELMALPIESDTERMLLILNLIEQNRLYERAAEHNDAPQLARVLRAFEPILVQLAAEDLSAEDAEALRAQLSFELNVMLTKLARESSEQTQDNAQETRT